MSLIENRPGAGTKIAYDAVAGGLARRADPADRLEQPAGTHLTQIKFDLLKLVPIAQTGVFPPWALVVPFGGPS